MLGFNPRVRKRLWPANTLRSIALQRQTSNLRMRGLHFDHRLRRGLQAVTEHSGCALKQLLAPVLDLVRMDVKILRQIDQGSGAHAAPLGGQSPPHSRP